MSDELPGLPEFPPSHFPYPIEREVSSEDGAVKLVFYRVGFQIQRDLRLHFDPWLRLFKAQIQLADGTQIGQLSYRLINGNFVDDCHEEFQASELGGKQLEAAARVLYEAEGAMQERWLTGPLSGSGVFGPEFNGTKAIVALLDCSDEDFLIVHEQYRRRGVALWAVRTLFNLLKDEGVHFMMTWPSVPRISPERKGTIAEQRLLRRNIAFARKAGFRRVGLSPVFAYVLHDENHPSRHLAMDRDVDPV